MAADFNTYSGRLRSARLAAGLSQAELAAAAGEGIHAPFISVLEGEAVERIVTVLAEALRARADAGDTIALAAWQQLPNVRSRSELAAELAAHPTRERQPA